MVSRKLIDYQDSYFGEVFRRCYYMLKNDEKEFFKNLFKDDFLKEVRKMIYDRKDLKNTKELVDYVGELFFAYEDFFLSEYGEAYRRFKEKIEEEGMECYTALARATLKEMQKRGHFPKIILETRNRFPPFIRD